MLQEKKVARRRAAHGCLLAIGGAEDPDESNMRILPHLAELAGGKKARVLLCGTPSEDPDDKMRTYRPLFESVGVAEVIEAPLTQRLEGEDPKLLEGLERATCVFFTGGDQLRLTSLIAGTSFGERIRERLEFDKLIVAGTSAGAAALGSVMPVSGSNDGTVRRSDVNLAPGLGLLENVLVDTHFSQRGRVSRLLTVFAQNPQILGIGIDENTAIEIRPGKAFRVVGEGVVTVLDGRVTFTNAAEVAEETPLTLMDVRLHVLSDGFGFDLEHKRPIHPGGTLQPVS